MLRKEDSSQSSFSAGSDVNGSGEGNVSIELRHCLVLDISLTETRSELRDARRANTRDLILSSTSLNVFSEFTSLYAILSD